MLLNTIRREPRRELKPIYRIYLCVVGSRGSQEADHVSLVPYGHVFGFLFEIRMDISLNYRFQKKIISVTLRGRSQ